jgi:hypothetical protein
MNEGDIIPEMLATSRNTSTGSELPPVKPEFDNETPSRTLSEDLLAEESNRATKQRNKLVKYYGQYDPMDGIRTAGYLAGFFGFLLLLFLYKSRTKRRPERIKHPSLATLRDGDATKFVDEFCVPAPQGNSCGLCSRRALILRVLTFLTRSSWCFLRAGLFRNWDLSPRLPSVG